MKCFHGCGKEAAFFAPALSRREKKETWTCAKRAAQCPVKMVKMRKKRLDTLAEVDAHGITGFTRNALSVAAARRMEDGTFKGTEKMVETKRNSKDSQGRDIYQQTAIKTAITRFGQYAGLEGKPEFEIYRYHVKRITEQQPLHLLPNHKKRAAYGKAKDPHQVDHKFSVVQGFLKNIPPYIIGHITNLEMLPSRLNNSKGASCSITEEALLEGFFSSIKT